MHASHGVMILMSERGERLQSKGKEKLTGLSVVHPVSGKASLRIVSADLFLLFMLVFFLAGVVTGSILSAPLLQSCTWPSCSPCRISSVLNISSLGLKFLNFLNDVCAGSSIASERPWHLTQNGPDSTETCKKMSPDRTRAIEPLVDSHATFLLVRCSV